MKDECRTGFPFYLFFFYQFYSSGYPREPFLRLQLQPQNIFEERAERYFEVSTESEAVLGDSKWFQWGA